MQRAVASTSDSGALLRTPGVTVYERGRVAIAIPVHDGFRIGRDRTNALMLADGKVSRHHAELRHVNGQWVAIDLGSTHGVFVNEQRTAEHALVDGDRVQLGNVLLVFTETSPELSVLHHVTVDAVTTARSESNRRLALLCELGGTTAVSVDADAHLAAMLRSVADVLGCQRACAGIAEGGGLRAVSSDATGDVAVSRALVDDVIGRRECVIAGAESGPATATMARHDIASAMAAPLVSGDRVLGFVYVDDPRPDAYSGDDLGFFAAVAHLLAAFIAGCEALERAERSAEAVNREAAGIAGSSDVMNELRDQLALIARAGDSNVLVLGESGVGKELAARTLHAGSPRKEAPFVAVNCAAIPDAMVESELFGHTKGAFTGALRAKRGMFALAHGGTLFLDEVGDLSPAAQAKLLRAIEQGEVLPLGSESTVRVDVRVVCATHKNLRDEIVAGRFRQDLYFRLAVIEVEVPPLRARGGDVVELAQRFLTELASGAGKHATHFTADALAALQRYAFPGNVRELRNEIERAVILAPGPAIGVADLSARVTDPPTPTGGEPEPSATPADQFARLEVTERRLVADALERSDGNIAEAARLLGISWIMMKKRVARFALQSPPS